MTNYPLLPGETFLIDLPVWLEDHCEVRCNFWWDTYQKCFRVYRDIYDMPDDVNGDTVQDLNEDIDAHCPDLGKVFYPLPKLYTQDYFIPLVPQSWPKGNPAPDDPASWSAFCMSRAWALMQGSFYGIFLQIQLRKFTKGYFGRHKQ
jgi:hypothetical protein